MSRPYDKKKFMRDITVFPNRYNMFILKGGFHVVIKLGEY